MFILCYKVLWRIYYLWGARPGLKFTSIKYVGRCDILNSNTENTLAKSVLVPVNSQMIAIKSWINKYYIIKFSIKSRKGKVPNS